MIQQPPNSTWNIRVMLLKYIQHVKGGEGRGGGGKGGRRKKNSQRGITKTGWVRAHCKQSLPTLSILSHKV